MAEMSPEAMGEAMGEASADAASSKEVFSTGVAKGRDRLDSAISTSSLKESEIEKLGARSLAEVFRNIPGIRAESGNGEGNNSYSIRGLPLASSGAKYLQFQEDGLPVLEFGDMTVSADTLMRYDLNLAQVEAIRGGSASTFASNSPGGVINLISKTGEVEGGAIQASTGVDYDEKRLDFDYGGRINSTMRFHVGGFYRTGEGPRETGYEAYKGGQLKLNITKEFDTGYIRLTGKWLDDHAPAYVPVPMHATGTNSNPKYESLPNFDISSGTFYSPYVANFVTLDGNNNLAQKNLRDGMHPIVKSIGLESQFDVAGWTITEKFRYADISGEIMQFQPVQIGAASSLAAAFGGAGATLSYATGPNAGQAITNPAGLNGNGLLAMALLQNTKLNALDNMTNDLRATRQWDLGAGTLTTTAGYYKSKQSLNTEWLYILAVSDVRGDGTSALVDITNAGGVLQTQDGVLNYAPARRKYDVDFDVSAPYASLNYHIGKIAVGGSIRYDFGKAQGALYGSELGGGRVGITSYDMNNDGVISIAETQVGVIPLSRPAPVNFEYEYLSYSAGVNYRIAEPLAAFARYSRGGRGAADRVLFTQIVSPTDGKLVDSRAGRDTIKQAEFGLKFRKSEVTLNLTGFWAETSEINQQTVADPNGVLSLHIIARTYSAKGLEFEGGIRRGPFSLTAGATYTDAKILADPLNTAVVGNTPRHQANFIFQATPQVELDMFTVGANFVGTTSSYTQDTNQLKLPGYTVVNAFLQFRPAERIELSLNANNLFSAQGFTEISQPALPASGMVSGRAINGRTISTSLRLSF
ncbi:outer membrane receptor protein involved in Fe transport [Sphingobium boeckii]|uniref:Outer membrane receptor protein involved in Fe transport n=2 Tax=Sphingobium boeckii TaxID=1082345 RepID=A0A7W9AGN4_9SPHN|nr:outer membrane receptor protein involved in Fe transport [Sphingobium boeckii]